jgi:serine/threonine-protein kinase
MSSSPSHLGPGTLLRDYRIESELGRGGQGVVYLAEHIHLRRRVALKVLPPELAADGDFRERFLREARIAAALEHPNILPIYDASEANGVLFLAMRLVQGEDLGIVLQREGALDPARALGILSKVAGALDEAHAKGLVHRDVKPSNILLEAPDRVFLSDFGLGKVFGDSTGQPGQPSSAPGISGESRALTRAGYFVGTPHYAAPEQIQGGPIGPWTDEYALAAVLFESVTGRVPFPRDVETATLVAQVTERVPEASGVRHGLPSALDRVIASGMAKRPEDRYRTCSDLVTAARSAVGGGATIAAPAPAIPAGSGVFSAPGTSTSGTAPSGVPAPGGTAPGVTPPPAPPIQFGGERPPSGPRRRLGPWMIGAAAGAAGVAVAVVAGIVFLAGGSPSPAPSPSVTGFSSPTLGPTSAPTTAPTTAPATSGPKPTTGPPPLSRTTVTRVEPFDGAGNIQPPFSQTEEHKGTCFSGSLVDNRADAWRCFANGNSQIFDPCFENFPGSATRVGCLANPNDHGVVLINLTQPLDPAGADPGGGPPGDWAVVLADNGTTCLRFGGAQDETIDGKPVEFLCQDGRAVGGEIDRKDAVWHALVGELKPKKGQPPKSPDIVNITQAFG